MNEVKLARGTPATWEFYEQRGWKRDDGKLVDLKIWGAREYGPIRSAMQDLRTRRIRDALGGSSLNFLECACGGSPAVNLASLCRHITAVDFSAIGLAEAAKALEKTSVPFATIQSDITKLPLRACEFDAAYCAQAIFHIEDPAGQAAAFDEIMRVVRPGGVAVFIMANPFPLMFPVLAFRRAFLAIPGMRLFFNRFRKKDPPLPFRAMRLGWMSRRLRRWGKVQIVTYRMASTWCNQKVTEKKGLGRVLWRWMQGLETHWPRLAAWLGCYVTIIVERCPNF